MVDLADHRQYVEPGVSYDSGGKVFSRLYAQGLRQEHRLLDVGCGSLRVGRLLIPYLDRGNYRAIEPQKWLVEAAIEHEIGAEILTLRDVQIDDEAGFNLTVFGEGVFDWVLVSSILTHVNHAQMEAIVTTAARALRSGGTLLCDYIDASGPHPHHEGEQSFLTPGWYPQNAPHFLECIKAPARGLFEGEVLDTDTEMGSATWLKLTRK